MVDRVWPNCHIEIACDVDNPLVGHADAAAVLNSAKRETTPEWVKERGTGLQIAVFCKLSGICQMAVMTLPGQYGHCGDSINADIKPGIGIVLNASQSARAVQCSMITEEGHRLANGRR